ncbi:MAG TPA: hypothetical protein PK306_09075 [Aquabacterium sp.]|nr:hypothetical protein [Aquabacterium sp.]
MNAVSAPEHRALSLVEIIDFKWLMAGDGHHVHVEHLQADPEYARQCLALAAASRIAALRDTARRLAATLGLVLPPSA